MREHASCVAVGTGAVLICGAPGSGKSALALQLMALGGQLVADDQTVLYEKDGCLWATAPAQICGLIEARGVGILAAEARKNARLTVIADLDHTETNRLPPLREAHIMGHVLPLLHKVDSPHFPAAVLHYLIGGRISP